MSNCSQPLGLGLSEELGVDEYRKQHEQEWQPTERELKAVELAERYHHEAEAYYRTVCTGPVLHGSVMPADHRELALVNGNAARLRKQIMTEAATHGISPQDMARAIGRHA
jgi:hypothetical protein